MTKTKPERSRFTLRMSETALKNIDTIAAMRNSSRTAVIQDSLTLLVKDLHHDMYADEFLSTLRKKIVTRSETRTVDLRLPKMLLDYLRLNQYNVSTCIKSALNLYRLP